MGCEGCARITLLVFNIIFFIIGSVCLGVGIWVVVDGTVFLEVLGKIPEDTSVVGSLIQDAAYILIGGGAAIFLIAFFGCCGAWKKNKCLLIVYAVIIGVLLLLQIGAFVTAYFFYDQIVDVLNDSLANALNKSYNSEFQEKSAGQFDYTGGNILSKGLDAIQIEFKCCGVLNYTDYPNDAFPPTCCPANYSGKIKDLADQLWKGDVTTYTTTAPNCHGNITYIETVPGCLDAIKDYILDKSIIFIGIAAGTIAVQLILVFLSCCLFCSIENEEKKP
ncbi:hypothetical protein EB796_012506 [Bugula neritina]|uniref:Tetraspanin n=1 Tax=Bugula neritina TaxID=10212 RepID=A0A7J7JV55_BUGNE|nr:hypothetical protein EB796_012506 [Bugula neritina]